jgi:Uma2 family endonuclease
MSALPRTRMTVDEYLAWAEGRPGPPPSAVIVENPVIIVEVLSPSTGRNDVSRKLAGYFRLPSVAHYLIIDPDEPLVIHHQRGAGGDILTHIVREGTLALDPPGMELAVADLYEARA